MYQVTVFHIFFFLLLKEDISHFLFLAPKGGYLRLYSTWDRSWLWSLFCRNRPHSTTCLLYLVVRRIESSQWRSHANPWHCEHATSRGTKHLADAIKWGGGEIVLGYLGGPMYSQGSLQGKEEAKRLRQRKGCMRKAKWAQCSVREAPRPYWLRRWEGTTHQRTQAVSGSWMRRGDGLRPRDCNGHKQPFWDPDFSPLRPISGFRTAGLYDSRFV